MTREIKFRAWLYIDGTMQYENLFGAEKFGGRDCEIMQYTGFKDKNGKEIYEGDLMLTDDMYHDLEDGVAINALPDGKVVLVEWSAGAFFVGDEMLSEMAPYYEIIGNIYENPELLTTSS